MTPEGKVKKKVTLLLKQAPHIWWMMPVTGGYSQPGLDYLGASSGRFFAVETKVPEKNLTPRQKQTALALLAAGATVFIVRGGPGDIGYDKLKQWLGVP